MSTKLATHSSTSRQIKDTSTTRSGGSWQGMHTVQYDVIKGPPSRGCRIQSRMAPGMHHACLNGKDTSKPRVRGGLSPAAGSRGSQPTYPIH